KVIYMDRNINLRKKHMRPAIEVLGLLFAFILGIIVTSMEGDVAVYGLFATIVGVVLTAAIADEMTVRPRTTLTRPSPAWPRGPYRRVLRSAAPQSSRRPRWASRRRS